MRYILGFLTFVGLVSSHHLVANIIIDGIDQGPGTCMRFIPPNTNPTTNLAAQDMACNIGGAIQQPLTCKVKAGSRVVAQWRTWPDGSQDVPLDVSHKGPCAVYMKRMGSNGAGTVAGGGWFKIWHDGVTNGLWCSERVRTNNQMAFTIPKSLQGGYYTLRMEQLALHEARVYGEAQWYFGCAQIFVYGTGGNDVPTNTVSIPGYVDYNHPGVLINIYDFPGEHPTNYQIPGPVPFVGSNTGGGAAIEPSVPFNPRPNYRSCIVKNANWCGVTLPNFTNVATCYAATENCANQETACYASAPPTGYQGCSYWGQLCEMARQKCASCENSPGSACQGPFPGFPTRNVF